MTTLGPAGSLLVLGLLATPSAFGAQALTTEEARPRALVELSPGEIAQRAFAALVSIRGVTAEGEIGGSGFLVDPSGTIVTNLHVIRGTTRLAVKVSNGDIYDRVRVRSFDERKDLAVIQIEGFGLSTLELANSDELAVGDKLFVVGNPKGLEGSLSAGIVSAIRHSEAGYKVIQTDAAANPGNSGGPVLNAHGYVVGVLTFKMEESEGLNFCVPSNYARGLLASQDSLTLSDLSQRLGATSADLFADRPATLPRVWKEFADGSRREVRMHGDRVYVEVLMPPEQAHLWHSAADLQRKGEEWVGAWRAMLTCNSRGKRCDIGPLPFVISSVSPTRIEGWYEQLDPNNGKFDCGKCRFEGSMRRHEFVWVPE